jgi:aminoglycoside 3-N-acetyltransferase
MIMTAGKDVTREDLDRGFAGLGLRAGQTVLVHSALRTVGRVAGGPDAVVDALLAIVGPTGTLVVPTFTFAHEAETDPVIDPARDRSEMGALTEAARRRPEARRTTAFRHSFAAIGRRAELLASVDPALSPFDLRSAFGVMLALDTQVVLLGVTYTSSTSHHFGELVAEVPYRQTLPKQVKVRKADGSVVPQAMVDYQPKSSGGSYYGSRTPDFNRLGSMLESRGLVSKAFVGNAGVRRFAMRDLIALVDVEAAKDYNVFRTAEGEAGKLTPLDFGQCVMSPDFADGAGRPNRVQWCVRDLALLEPSPAKA